MLFLLFYLFIIFTIPFFFLKDAAEVLERPEYNIIHDALSEELVDAIKILWKEKGIKKAYERRDEYQLYDCAE